VHLAENTPVQACINSFLAASGGESPVHRRCLWNILQSLCPPPPHSPPPLYCQAINTLQSHLRFDLLSPLPPHVYPRVVRLAVDCLPLLASSPVFAAILNTTALDDNTPQLNACEHRARCFSLALNLLLNWPVLTDVTNLRLVSRSNLLESRFIAFGSIQSLERGMVERFVGGEVALFLPHQVLSLCLTGVHGITCTL
jgi:hypothetical protein